MREAVLVSCMWLSCLAAYLIGAVTGPLVIPGFDRAALAADNHTLREANKTLRAQCPARPRLQRGPFLPGSTA